MNVEKEEQIFIINDDDIQVEDFLQKIVHLAIKVVAAKVQVDGYIKVFHVKVIIVV